MHIAKIVFDKITGRSRRAAIQAAAAAEHRAMADRLDKVLAPYRPAARPADAQDQAIVAAMAEALLAPDSYEHDEGSAPACPAMSRAELIDEAYALGRLHEAEEHGRRMQEPAPARHMTPAERHAVRLYMSRGADALVIRDRLGVSTGSRYARWRVRDHGMSYKTRREAVEHVERWMRDLEGRASR